MSSRLSLPVWFFALIVLLPFAARSEGLYIAAHWPGEYPAGLFVKKDVSLPAYRSPDLKNKSNQTCTLPKGMVLHPWSQKRPQVKFASSWVPQKFLAKPMILNLAFWRVSKSRSFLQRPRVFVR